MARKRQKKSILEKLIGYTSYFVEEVRDYVSESQTFRKVALELFWFAVLLSWLPVVAGYTGFLDNFILGRWGPTLEPSSSKLFWLGQMWLPLALSVTASIVLLAVALRMRLLLLCAIPPFVSILVAYTSNLPTSAAWYYLSIVYLLFFVVSFVLTAWFGRLRSTATAMFVALCVWDSVIHLMASIWRLVRNLFSEDEVATFAFEKWTVLRRIMDSYSVSLFDLIAFLACFVFARFLVLSWQQNTVLMKTLINKSSKSGIMSYVAQALKLWWPMPILFILFGLILYPKITSHISLHIAKSLHTDLSEAGFSDVGNCEIEIEPMVRCLIEHNRREYQKSATSAIDDIQWAAVKSSEDLRNYVYPTLETKIFPHRLPGTQTGGCGRMSIPCHAKNGVKSVANSAYRRLRDPPLAATKATIDDIYERVGNEGDAAATEAKNEIRKQIDNLAAQSHFAFTKALYANRMFSLIMLMLSIMVLLKTFFIVLARCIFDTRNTNRYHASIAEVPPGETQSTVEHVKQPYILRKRSGRNYFLRREVGLPAGLPLYFIPYPTKAILTRLRWKAYGMSFVDVANGQYDEVQLQLPGLHELVRWEISAGEEVIFRYRDLVGYSSKLKVETLISFSLQSLIFGRVVFHKAVGPGVLFLRTIKKPTVGAADQARTARDAGTLISWVTSTPFETHSDLNLVGVFFRGYNIEKQTRGKVVFTADAGPGNTARMGISRWIRTFLSPI